MAIAAVPARFSRGHVRRLGKHLRAFAAAALTPARPVLANLASIPLTVAGIGCIDAGVFTANVVAGWIVTGLSLMVLEHLIADEDR